MRADFRRSAIGLGLMSVAIAIALGSTSGCGGGPPASADEDRAREVLNAALEGWRGGASIEDLKQESPSIVVSDPEWAAGSRLSRFEVDGDGKPSGAERLFTVTLWLEKSGGEEATEAVEYKVGTNPILTVFRAIF